MSEYFTLDIINLINPILLTIVGLIKSITIIVIVVEVGLFAIATQIDHLIHRPHYSLIVQSYPECSNLSGPHKSRNLGLIPARPHPLTTAAKVTCSVLDLFE